MFWQMIKGALIRQKNKFILIGLTVALGVSLAAAMLNVMFDVGDKVNQELKAYGANIVVTPKNSAVLKEIFGVDENKKIFLNENDLGKIKTIFWTNNIVAFAPFLDENLQFNGENFPVVGTWFNHEMNLPTGENFSTGVSEMKSWWNVEGNFPAENEILIGKKIAAEKNFKIGDNLTCKNFDGSEKNLKISGILSSGGDDDSKIFMDLKTLQEIVNLPEKISSIEVSAITTPENDLARKAAANPDLLSQQEKEIWYCTAYVSAIAYQIEEVIKNSSARPVRQIAESEGKILEKTQLLMLLITILSLLSTALGVSNLVSANVMERSRELGLLKAIGATNLGVIFLILAEIFLAGIVGGVLGFLVSIGISKIIGITVFGAEIATNFFVIPIVTALMILVLLVGSVPAIKFLLSLQPAEVLHGR